MSTVNGKLLRVADPTAGFPAEPGSILLTLCGYGSQVPRISGGTIANLEYDIIPPIPTNTTWSVIVAGNDVIRPAGTYYTLAYKNANGDIAQVMAFIFADGQSYDVDLVPSFDPSQQPPPSLPTPIVNQLEVVLASQYPEGALFDGTKWTSFQYILDIDGHTNIANGVAGNLYTYIIVQDSVGGHTLDWQQGIMNASAINPAPNGVTVQTFVAIPDSSQPYGMAFYPISAATWS